MGHPATEPPAKQEGKQPRDADLLGCLTPTGCSTSPGRAFDTAGCWGAIGCWPGGPLVRVVGSMEINQPASEVWAYVADYGNDPSWRGAVTQMRPSVPGPAQVGVTTHELLRLLGLTFRTDARIDRVEAGRLLEWRADDGRSSCKALGWSSRPARPAPASPRWSRVAWSGCRGRSGHWLPGCSRGRPPPTCDGSNTCWRPNPSAGPSRRNRRPDLGP
jgi:Polyketide cyclase / dehydrase and lipid transport